MNVLRKVYFFSEFERRSASTKIYSHAWERIANWRDIITDFNRYYVILDNEHILNQKITNDKRLIYMWCKNDCNFKNHFPIGWPLHYSDRNVSSIRNDYLDFGDMARLINNGFNIGNVINELLNRTLLTAENEYISMKYIELSK